MRQLLIVLLLVISIVVPSYAQQKNCGTDEIEEVLQKTDPLHAKRAQQRETFLRSAPLSTPYTGIPDTIRVVVHVINLGSAVGSYNNPADTAIKKMIDRLNQCFKASYQDQYGLNQSVGVDIGIYFKLADRDTACRPTNGIVRVDASSNVNYVNYGAGNGGTTGITQSELAALSYWDNTKYFNIWLVNKVWNGVYAGVGFLPPGIKTVNDGVVMAYYCVNDNTVAHETGHFLGLNHTFGGSIGTDCPVSTNNCLVDNDGICDTDPHPRNTGGCSPANINPCTGLPYGNIVYNHMSYSCGSIFTPGQRDRMRSSLSNFRASLLLKNNCPVYVYRFLGDGDWNKASNWANGNIPPEVLPANCQVVIDPIINGECKLSSPQFISYGSSFVVQPGKRLSISDELINTSDTFNLDYRDIELLDSNAAPTPGLKAIVGRDGQPLSKVSGASAALSVNSGKVVNLINNMLSYAQNLSSLKDNLRSSEGTNKPSQYGLAYRFGGSTDNKNIQDRLNPTDGDELHKRDAVYGTDCSGFLINLLRQAGIINMGLCGANSFHSTLKSALERNGLYKNVRIENLGFQSVSNLKSGDFLIWKYKDHDAVFANLYSLQPIIFNSNGNPYPLNPANRTTNRQTKTLRTAEEEQAWNRLKKKLYLRLIPDLR